jgi:hypothetical protein
MNQTEVAQKTVNVHAEGNNHSESKTAGSYLV